MAHLQIGMSISDAAAPGQLLECAEETLFDLILRAQPQFTNMQINDDIGVMKSLAVVPVCMYVCIWASATAGWPV